MLELVPLLGGGAAIILSLFLAYYLSRKPRGNKKMEEISDYIHKGALAFLKEEYKIIAVFVIVISILLLLLSHYTDIPYETSIAFIVGAFFSALAGNIGMRIATKANARAAQASRKGILDGLMIAFSSGAVMGMAVVGLGLLGVATFYVVYGSRAAGILFGFGFGASSIALFARVGGGIYTKSADIGADLVGKVEEGIPEDDPRNPAVIADNVGDNVGDVAGMGADLFESYVDSIISAISLGALVSYAYSQIYPLLIAAVGIFSSMIAMVFVRSKNPYAALRNGLFGAAILFIIFAFITTYMLNKEYGLFYSIVVGLIDGLIIGISTEYFTSHQRKPARKIAEAAKRGAATNILEGMSVGMISTAIPIISTAIAMVIAHEFANFYGVALAAVGMLSTLGISLATDCYGPVADNAAGISEMAELGEEIRRRTEELDAVGNTTAAMGKGFAIGSAAITALALIFTFFEKATRLLEKTNPNYHLNISLTNPYLMAGLFMGAMLPFIFSALTLGAVGRTAEKMVDEVRRQFKEYKILEGKGKPDYEQCIRIATKGALKEMVLPSLLAVIVPIAMGIWKIEALIGLLAGSTATGFLLAIFLANAGGAWDNAKKYIEEGNLGGKGSFAHKSAVVGDTVGDPCKDTAGPSLNILIKLMSIVSLVFLPLFIKLVH
ncbi:MAG: sodium-translocating pyrophosphatase [Thermoplasmata archaeon]|nr:MAG: sodium-translocating pyrophosphatase [Thermoplasmata archaeon]